MFEVSLLPVSTSDQLDLEKRNKDNHYALGNILFLGELFNRNLVPPSVIEGILSFLLQKINEGLALEPEIGMFWLIGSIHYLRVRKIAN
jgi:hypothetical protein